MSLKDYLTTLEALIAETPFVTSVSFSYDERPPTAGLVKGTIFFDDKSHLDFKEFIITQPTLQIIKYAYNYRKEHLLIFRYDNANDPAARNLPTYPSHKHVPGDILEAQQPSLSQVLQEILPKIKFP
ncbi:MAG: hypothetical protein KGZ49_02190 [Syntrophaceae bacterium]|nr:hypothetical protein [Syntrophaceae bacterium]